MPGSAKNVAGRTDAATAARKRWVRPDPGGPQSTTTVSRGSARATSAIFATASALRPATKFANDGGSAAASSNVSCCMRLLVFAVHRRREIRRAQVAQPDEQRRRRGQREQHAGETEELPERKQREDHGERMQANAIADEIGDEHVRLDELADRVHRQ